MAVVVEREPGIVGNNPAVVDLIFPASPFNPGSPTTIIVSTSPVLRPASPLIYDGVGTQGLGEVLAAFSINHAG